MQHLSRTNYVGYCCPILVKAVLSPVSGKKDDIPVSFYTEFSCFKEVGEIEQQAK